MKNLVKKVLVLAGMLAILSCQDDDIAVAENPEAPSGEVMDDVAEIATTTFDVTIRNTVNILNTKVFNTPVGAAEPGPAAAKDAYYEIDFKAAPGTYLSFATMQAATNDWFFAPKESGIKLFDDSGAPVTGDVTSQIYLWDSGTENEDPEFIATAPNGQTEGEPDADTSVRVVKEDVTPYLKVDLAWNSTTKTFTLKLINVVGNEAAKPIILTPGLIVLHAQKAALFSVGEPDRGFGLKEIAEGGMPKKLYDWFKEEGTTEGAFLRMSASLVKFSPALIYAFDGKEGAKDPFFTQGEAAVVNSGLEELAEDGNRSVAYNYIKDELNIPVAASNEEMPIGPGQEFTFTIEVPTNKDYKFSLLTMLVPSNDWFISHNTAGLALFDEEGNPMTYSNAGTKTYLYDAGTEADQPIGAGNYQASIQMGPNEGPADADTTVRRVPMIMDGQFGKDVVIGGGAGVTWNGDPRGGYNFIEVDITPR
ncbi:spondin domain-containing protein [Aquimarina agarivorans]|uniref:spondin domain-containing protein n=1 Tax=Aquimarina agarivorans TaxID=980584 RepID=UPI000248E745|nr:spondin domain-containing protein [Aquimarina agarivorans]